MPDKLKEMQDLFYEFWGSDLTFPHYSAAWAWAFSTPFQWVKQVASHFGGTRQGMCISWPGHITDVGGIRTQFHHVIDIVPTILEAAGVQAPQTINGIAQRPFDGVSMAYTWEKDGAAAPPKRTTQYFEMLGNRGIYHDGWYACTTPATVPWDLGLKPTPDVITGYTWELYNIDKDFSQAHDLASQMPDKLKEMQDLFYAEARTHDVLPLDNSSLARFLTPRPSPTAGVTSFTYTSPMSGVPPACGPNTLDRSYTIEAVVEIPAGGAEGMLVTEGGRFGGYGLYLDAGVLGFGRTKPVFLYNLLGLKHIAWVGPELDPGTHTIVFDWVYDGPGFGKGGTGTLTVDGKVADTKKMENSTPITFPEDESFDIGMDMRTPVALLEHRYECPFPFTGTIKRVTITLGPHQYPKQ